ncbi:fatty acid-binding protein DegV [Corynebacterium sp. 13CS0277]|uniref:DegV family protein n=1 Tax=Corynebacterium sp. 13CS0277 TaxID=2071994 RepID=UPI000D047B7D|nr:DegV family protein [Corynebacterium sp. 13CS0277]PRQ11779.1 fatty acid-binding protein DegV [Corynebacterium sp. 13CS0277]
MPVRVVVDSSANLPADIAAELGITVVDLHMMRTGGDASTAGLSALELVATYARQLERGGDEGVVALHLSKELSSTWSAAVTAAGVFEDRLVRVVDTDCIGMGVGAAAMAAARLAQQGAGLEECYDLAASTVARSELWLYVHKIDALRRSGRLSTADALVSTALATRPIMHLRDGKLEIAAKTRTQSKAFAKLVDLITQRAAGLPVFVAIQQFEAREAARGLADALEQALPQGSSIMVVELDSVLAVHAGPGAVAVSVVFTDDVDTAEDTPALAGEGTADTHTTGTAAPADAPAPAAEHPQVPGADTPDAGE